MHELSVAQSIVAAVLLEAEKNGARQVKEINVGVGELMQLDMKALEESMNLLMTGPKLQGAKVILKVQQASFVCRKCSAKWDMVEAKKQLARNVPDKLKIREPDSEELPLHFLPYLYPVFIRCPNCGSSDTSAVAGEDIRLRKLVME